MHKNIFFIGFMGTGKSTIGRLVADRLNLDFIDTDEYIEGEYSMSISDIFTRYGEEHFRRFESELIKKMSKVKNTVISTGGGTPLYDRNLEIMKENGLVITLEASAGILWTRLKDCGNRPLLQIYDTFESFNELYNRRKRIYDKGDAIIGTDGKSIEQVVCESIKYILD